MSDHDEPRDVTILPRRASLSTVTPSIARLEQIAPKKGILQSIADSITSGYQAEEFANAAVITNHAVHIVEDLTRMERLFNDATVEKEKTITAVKAEKNKQAALDDARFVEAQALPQKVAFSTLDFDRQINNVKYSIIEDKQEHQNRMRTLAGKHYVDPAEEKKKETDASLRVRASAIVDDVAEQFVRTDAAHLYASTAALLYWGDRLRGVPHADAHARTTNRIFVRMRDDHILLPEAIAAQKKWELMQVAMGERERAADEAEQAERELAEARERRASEERIAELQKEKSLAQERTFGGGTDHVA